LDNPSRIYPCDLRKKPNARIQRARRTPTTTQVSQMKASLFALRCNELLGGGYSIGDVES
jgi:hypothetical protein